jgi:hypothetical protein
MMEIPEALSHYLLVGCWAGGARGSEERFQVWQLAGAVFHGRFDGLRAAWQDCGAALKRTHPAPTYAEEMLAGRLDLIDTESWPAQFGRMGCRLHPVMPPSEDTDTHNARRSD